MGIFKKTKEWAEALNTYYQAILILYPIVLGIAALSRSQILIGISIVAPFLAAWGGYVVRPIVEERTLRYGFRIISDSVTYEIENHHKYALRYDTELEAAADHLMAYPIGYRWTGGGAESTPKLSSPNQMLLAPLRPTDESKKTTPYEAIEDAWHYWFVAFTPAIHKNGRVKIKYSQDFRDNKKQARPYLAYYVRKPMKTLELSVKFPNDSAPNKVRGSFIKTNDLNRPYKKPGVVYDKHKQWATWTIHHPKRGYYRLDW